MVPMNGLFSKADEQIMFHAMEEDLNIVNGLHEFLTDKAHFAKKPNIETVKLLVTTDVYFSSQIARYSSPVGI
jgi:hypothetical protein